MHGSSCWRFRSGPDLKSNVASWIGAATFAKVTGGKVFDPAEGKLYPPEDSLSSLGEVERDILQVEERPRKSPAPSHAVISVRLCKEEQGRKDS
jgi:hypothetical protein